MEIRTLQVGSLQTNCYIVFDALNALIIDPGDDAEYIVNTIKDLGVSPKMIIATHAHFDHILAVNELKLAFKIPFVMNKKDEVLLSWFRKSTIHFTGYDPGPNPTVDRYLDREFTIHNLQFTILHTPGHTPGGVCLSNEQEKIVFVGDNIFANGETGRWDFPYSNKEDLLESVKKIRRKFKGFTALPGHGDNFLL